MPGKQAAAVFCTGSALHPRLEQIPDNAEDRQREDKNHRDDTIIKIRRRLEHEARDKSKYKYGGDGTKNALPGFAGTDLGCQLAASEAAAGKVSGDVGDPYGQQHDNQQTRGLLQRHDRQPCRHQHDPAGQRQSQRLRHTPLEVKPRRDRDCPEQQRQHVNEFGRAGGCGGQRRRGCAEDDESQAGCSNDDGEKPAAATPVSGKPAPLQRGERDRPAHQQRPEGVWQQKYAGEQQRHQHKGGQHTLLESGSGGGVRRRVSGNRHRSHAPDRQAQFRRRVARWFGRSGARGCDRNQLREPATARRSRARVHR